MNQVSAAAKPAREKRWLVVAEDGSRVTLGRHSDPSSEEIARAGQELEKLGVAGWLVVSEGGYYGRRAVPLLMVRQITEKAGDWPAAEMRWQKRRSQVI